MRIRIPSWHLTLLLSVGCGYVGVNDLEQVQLGDDAAHPDSTGGKTDAPSGGDSGDGDMAGTGSEPGSGGAEDEPGSGGQSVGMGGEDSGTGGAGSPDAQVWSDPDREGCDPLCSTYNASFSTHFLFEQAAVPAPGAAENGELFVSPDYANWGESSLGVSFGESPASAYIPIEIDAGLESWIYVRAWLFVPSDVITGDVGLLEFLSGEVPAASVDTHPGARLSASAPIDEVTMISEDGAYPLDEWFCLRAAVYTDHVAGSVTVESAGAVVTELTGVDTRWVVDVNAVNFGVTHTGSGQGSGTIYWDSIVIDQDPVDCETMAAPQSP